MTDQKKSNLLFAFAAFVTFVFTFFRYQNLPGVFTKLGIVVADTAPYYRLHRIEQVVLGNWVYPLFDLKMDFPGGWNVAWPMGMDYFFAVPLKLLGVTDPTTIMAASCLMLPLLAFPLLFLTVSVTSTFSTRAVGWLAGLFLACLPSLIYQTGIGRIDHQFLEAVFAILTLYVFLRIKNHDSSFSRGLFVLSIGLASAIYPHGWFPCFFLCLALVLEKNIELLQKISKLLFYSFLVSLVPLTLTERFMNGYISMTGFSWWATFCLSCASVYVLVLTWIRGRKISDPKNALWIWGSFVITLGFLIYKNPQFFIRETTIATSWLAEKKGTLSTMYESRTIFQIPWKELADGRLVFVMPLVYLWFIAAKKHHFLLLFSLIPICLSFIQVRFLTPAYPFITILLVLFLWDVVGKIAMSFQRRMVVLSIATVSIIAWNMPTLGFTHYNIHDSVFYSVRAASWFMKSQVKQRNMEPLKAGVISPWDYGDWILYYSQLPIVASSFQSHQALETDELYASEKWKDFETYEKKYPASFLMIEQSFPRYWTNLMNMGKDPEQYFSKPQTNANTPVMPLKKFENVFYYRFLEKMGADEEGNFPSHWRLSFVSPYPSENSSGLPGVKVFERVPGAIIQKKHSAHELWLKVAIHQKDGKKYVIQQKSTVLPGQIHQWHVPYSEYARGQVYCDGVYSMVDRRGSVVQQLEAVSEKQVLEGALIKLP